MLKYENVANIGDTIKAFDFEPIPGRPDSFLIGKVIDKGMVNDSYLAYTVEVIDGDDDSRNGATMYVPFESSMDYDGRVSRISVAEQDDKEYDDELANIGARIIASASWKSCNTKKEAASIIYKDFGHNGRKFVINLFKEILGMSQAGASTYYHNAKKGA